MKQEDLYRFCQYYYIDSKTLVLCTYIGQNEDGELIIKRVDKDENEVVKSIQNLVPVRTLRRR